MHRALSLSLGNEQLSSGFLGAGEGVGEMGGRGCPFGLLQPVPLGINADPRAGEYRLSDLRLQP